ncbi:MAG TPA: exonuclease domain-containing protein [Ignavibacteriaceae bacterium]|nr:exonuclease domain-containing protein [Ignavibacteriaceae bacterium]
MPKEKLSQTPLEEAEFCVVDTETTGLSPRSNNIIEIGLVKISRLKVVETYHSMINPGRSIPYFITNLTGISDDDVYDAPFFEDIAEEIIEFIGEKVIAAHNLSFDKSFLRYEFRSVGKELPTNSEVCTLKLARKLYPALKSKSLGSVCSHLKLKNSGAHRALSDAEVTGKALIKMIKEAKKKHNINYLDEFVDFQKSSPGLYKPLKIKKKLSEDVFGLPNSPGVYYFLNSKDQVIYIGKAKSLRDRVKSYFSSTAPRKAKKIIKQASRIRIEQTNSELTALLLEAESIKLIKPKHNSQLKRYGNKYFLRITAKEKFPAIEICNHFDFDGNDYFGLFISRRKAETVFDVITKIFALRECDNKELDKGKRCFLAEIERCVAPCDNKDKILYREELDKVYEFLYGKNQEALNRLLNKMKYYSDTQKYEKAAEVKELIDMILAQTHKSSLLAEPVNLANVLFEISAGYDKDYILMFAGRIFIKKYSLKSRDYFEDAIDDYYEETLNINSLPDDEDLEKMKITLSWLIKNRNKVRVYYLKDYVDKGELFAQLSKHSFNQAPSTESTFDIKDFMKAEVG